MAVPSLVIGLGGTGQWVLTYLKKNLYETYGGIPPEVRIRSFDTVKISRARAGSEIDDDSQTRTEQRSVAGVSLEPGEFIHVGGYVKDYVRQIAQDEENEGYPHLRSWFQAKYYLDNLPDQQFHLDEGAGQFRQFGRLAVFYDLKAATVSRIYGQLQDTIQEIQKKTNSQNLQVLIVGSLAGGTGAGMFVDVAHLVRRIADEHAHMEVNVRGFLVLPDAFGAIASSSVVKRGMNARAFAAMRETKRFSINFDWDLGYPMYYKASSSTVSLDPVLQSAIKGQLFDHLYYLDGHRTNFPLYSIPLEEGVAPSIADMMGGMLDEKSSGAYTEHEKNLQAMLTTRGGSSKTPYYGSVGSYSIVFPITHIVESYAHRLGLETLQHLLQPVTFDDRTKLPTRLASDRNEEAGVGYSGAAASRAFLTSASVVDPTDPTIAVDSTLLLPELVDIAERYSPNDASIVETLASRSLDEWNRLFAPTGQSEDVLTARQRAEIILNVRLIDEVPPSKVIKPKEDPKDGQYRIENGVRTHKNVYLGAERPETGQRSGGKYREALNEYSNVHLNRFQRMLQLKMIEILNGRSAKDPLIAKSGKVGHLADFLEQTLGYLDTAYVVMTKVMELRRSQSYGRSQAVAAAQNALEDMKRNAYDTRPIFGKAHKTQEIYLDLEQALIEIHKLEIMEQAVADTIRQMYELTATASVQVQNWISVLGVGADSLYAQLLTGRRQVDANRDKDADVESRLVLGARKQGVKDSEKDEDYVRFKKYEEERYRHYTYDTQTNQVAAILGDLNWQVQLLSSQGKPVFEIGLTLTSPTNVESRSELEADPKQHNKDLFLARASSAYKIMIEEESIIGYLMYAYKNREVDLADKIHARSGPLLAHESSGPIPANYLRVAYGDDSNQKGYLRTMLGRLASQSQITDVDKFAKLVNSSDRFTLNLAHTVDLIELNSIRAYSSARTEYMGYRGERNAQTSLRTILHVFPAEVNAVQMEERLPELNQTIRMLHDDIVLQLEKLDLLNLFLFAYAYGLVERHSFDKDGQSYECFRVTWQPAGQRDSGEVWLTAPSKDEKVSFLDALTTFNYVGRDVGHGEGYFKDIDYDAIRETLTRHQLEDMEQRRRAGTLGDSDATLQSWLQGQQPLDDDPVWEWIARHDRLAELEKRMETNLSRMKSKLKDNPSLQADFDLTSVFVLTLRDELGRLKRRIRSRAPRDTRNEPKSSTSKKSSEDDLWW